VSDKIETNMNEQPTPKTDKPQSKTAPERNMKGLSTMAPEAIHNILEHAQTVYDLDKSGVLRLALRLFIKKYYKGKGVWEYDPTLEDDCAFADSVSRMGNNLLK